VDKKSPILNKILSSVVSFLLLFQSFAPSLVYAQEATSTAAVETTPSPSIEPSPSPESTPTLQPSPSAEPTTNPESSPSPSVLPEASLEITSSPTPSSEPSATDQVESTGSPEETVGQPNAPPAESPNPFLTPEPSPSAEVEQPAKGHLSATILENTDAQSLELDLSTQSDVSSASLSTDKADYAPTDTAVITGADFPKGEDLKLIITAENYRFETGITTDENGSFIYFYQLDGTYRPLYTVEAQDLSGQILATTSFTDTPQSGCTNDSAGANDEPGQKDLTRMCVDYTDLPNEIDVQFNWDNTSWPGGNTGDGCSLYDTDGDGLVNFAVCVTVGGSPAQIQTTTLYSCNDTKSDRCAGKTEVSITGATSCTASISETDPFAAGQGYPNDTQADCDVDLDDVGGSGAAVLVDVCSYPSQEPNSDPSDCIVFKENTGRLEVVKDLVPNDDTGLFNLQINGNTEAENVGDGGTTGEKVLSVTGQSTDYTVGETAGTGTNLSNYTTSIVCKDLNGTGSIVAQATNAGPLTVTLHDNDDIVCTITNTQQNGTLIVKKVVVNDNGGTKVASDFSFQINGGTATSFETDGQNDLTVSTGTYTITEPAVAGYATTYDNCSNLNISNGGSATCTITNDDIQPKLTLTKVVVNDNGGIKVVSDFPLFVDAISVTSGVQNGFNAGTYTVSETSQSGYTAAISGDCAGNGSITLSVGDVKSCTITNDDTPAHLIVIKNVINDNGGSKNSSDFTMHINGTSVGVGVSFAGADNPGVNTSVNAGIFTVTEDSVAGYASNASGDCSGSIALGQTKTCTITNDDTAPSLTLLKTVTTDNGGTAVNTEWTLTATGTSGSPTNLSGTTPVDSGPTFKADTYALAESGGPSGYTAGVWNCEGGTMGDATHVTVALGQSVTCTITNDDIAPTLTLVKNLPNDNGGTATQDDFNVYINGQPAIWGQNTVNAGDLTVSEDTLAGYEPSAWGGACDEDGNTTLLPGDNKICTITNDDQPGSLSGIKWNDEDGNGTLDCFDDIGCEEGLPEWNIFLDANENGVWDDGEEFVETTDDEGEEGEYSFNNLDAGTYRVCEMEQSGWEQTFPDNGELNNCHEVTAGLNEQVRDIDFGNQGQATITVRKNVDNNGDGEIDEENATDWTWDIDGQGDFETGNDPQSVAAGSYTVSEDQQDGFHVTSVECNNEELFSPSERIEVSVEPGQDLVCTFTNARDSGSVTIIKDLDNNGNGDTTDEGDTRNAQGWTYDIANGGQDNPMGGSKTLSAGSYTISEDEQSGYKLLSWSCSNEQTGTTNSIAIDVRNGSQTTCTFTNQLLPPVLSLTKSNDKTGIDVSAGANVSYTLTVTLTGSPLSNVSLIDLPPAGFNYRLGSWTAVSSVRGDLKPEITTEPTYASPGTWNLGDMESGEVVTLTYIADIDTGTDPGLYKDLAWSKGTNSSSTVLANEDSGFFVGTEVNVVKDQGGSTGVNVERIEEKEGEVLGASIELPATGANAIWLLFATFLLIGGGGLIWKGISLRKKYE